MKNSDVKIALIGLGYVGLPLAVEFSKKYPTIGFDIKKERIAELESGHDGTLEVSDEELRLAQGLKFSCVEDDIKSCNVYIVTVPTPIDEHRQPDLTPLIKASELLGRVIKNGDVVIYESTVYPGATEEDCIPVVEKISGLKLNQGFYAGYSPERINPGDKDRPVTKIKKVTSGSTPEIADFVDSLYLSIIEAGTFKASSIKVAEASKIIENTQRDVNIALVNELSMICSHLGINTHDVIEAAATKWNFIKLQPGLVGGHCIGVDPYYLVQKSISVGFIPDIIRKAREVNDGMARFVAEKLIKGMINNNQFIKGSRALVLGMTFKENCPDIRNTKVVDLIKEMQGYGIDVDVYDPWVNSEEALHEYGITLTEKLKINTYDSIVIAVGHEIFRSFRDDIRGFGKESCTILDIKNSLKNTNVSYISL